MISKYIPLHILIVQLFEGDFYGDWLYHTQWCLGITPGFVLMNYF